MMVLELIAPLLTICGGLLFGARIFWLALFYRSKSVLWDLLACFSGLLSLSFLITSSIDESRISWSTTYRLIAVAGLVALVILLSLALTRLLSTLARRERLIVFSLMFLFCIATTAGGLKNLQQSIQPPDEAELSLYSGTCGLDVVFDGYGLTDLGHRVEFNVIGADDEKMTVIAKSLDRCIANFGTDLIHRNNVDLRANCHGWVFADGEHRISSDDVDIILVDNGYELVIQPMPGDVIIYRSAIGDVLHSGLVQGILADGTVIVESKWSFGPRFLHLPEQQPYSTLFEYYRTPRANHSIAIQRIETD